MIPAQVDCSHRRSSDQAVGETVEPSGASHMMIFIETYDLYRNNMPGGTFLHCGGDAGGCGPRRVMSNLVVFEDWWRPKPERCKGHR